MERTKEEKEYFGTALRSRDVNEKIKKILEQKTKTHEDLKVLLLYDAAEVTEEVLRRYVKIGVYLRGLELRLAHHFAILLLGMMFILSFFATFHWVQFGHLFVFTLIGIIAAMIMLDIEFRKKIREVESKHEK